VRRALLFICAAALAAEVGGAPSGIWGNRGISRRFVVRGSRVFAADGRGMAVYDVSQSIVRRLAVAETASESLDLAFLNDREVAVATRNGIDRYAVGSDGTFTPIANYPSAVATVLVSNARYLGGITPGGITIWENDALGVVNRFPLMQPAVALAWHGDTLLAAVPGQGVYFFGAGDPGFVSENARDLAVVGDRLYIAAGVNGIAIYDIRDDAAPMLISRSEGGDRNFVRIAVSESRLFAAELPDTVSVYDISGGGLSLAARFKEPVQTIAASGTRLFISGTIFDGFGLPTETGAPIRVFDGTIAVGEFRDLAGPLSGVATDGSLAYVVDRPYFRIIDISNTATPRELSSMLIDGIGDRIKIRGGQALIYGRGDVQLIDIANPYAPRLINVYHSQGGPPSTAAFGRNLILEGNPYSGFHVVDFANFDEPRQIGGIKGHYFEVAANGGDFAYVSLQSVDLVTIDLSDPGNPQSGKRATIGPAAIEMIAATERHPELLMVQTRIGIRLYNLNDARNPVELSFTPTAAVAAISADTDTAYLAIPGQVATMDLSNPAHPPISITPMQPFSPMQIASARGKLVIADRYSLRVFGPDTPPPPSPPPSRHRPSRP
jgi:hypothetical protein